MTDTDLGDLFGDEGAGREADDIDLGQDDLGRPLRDRAGRLIRYRDDDDREGEVLEADADLLEGEA